MAYAGYVPAKLPPGKASPYESALWSIKEPESLVVLHKLLYNTACQPGEAKFRKVKLSNGKIRQTVVEVPGALEALKLCGWEEAEEEGEPVLLLRRNVTMAEVRQVQDAQERLKKELAQMHRSKSAKSLADETLQRQIEGDRAERAAREPITKNLSASSLPGADGSGPRIAGGKDAGFSHGCGC